MVRAHVYVSAGVEAAGPPGVGELAAVFAQAYVSQDAVAAQLVVVLGLLEPHDASLTVVVAPSATVVRVHVCVSAGVEAA